MVFRYLTNNNFVPSKIKLLVNVISYLIIAIGMVSVNSAYAGWQDILENLNSKVNKDDNNQLSSDKVTAGIKEALQVGTKKSIDLLGKRDGFYKDAEVKIPMPENLIKMQSFMERIGQKKLMDKFVVSMNRAAEQSVHATFDIFISAIKEMTLKDAIKIYNGRNDEATRYFRTTKGQQIHNTIHPIVAETTQKVGVTSNYKKITRRISRLQPSLAKQLPDIDNYVTEKTMDGIFKKIAHEEALIRKDPVARTTDLLKAVFGQTGK